MKSETGESSNSITASVDDDQMDRVMTALRGGATLSKLPGLDRYYVTRGVSCWGGGSLSEARVRKLELNGVLINVGVHRYALAENKGSI